MRRFDRHRLTRLATTIPCGSIPGCGEFTYGRRCLRNELTEGQGRPVQSAIRGLSTMSDLAIVCP